MYGGIGPGVNYERIQDLAALAERLAKKIHEESGGDPEKIKVALAKITEPGEREEVRGNIGWIEPSLIQEGRI